MKRLLKLAAQRSSTVDRIARRLIAAVPYRVRLGAPFAYWYALFLEAEDWDDASIQNFRHELLVNLLNQVATQSPYYKALLDGQSPEAVAHDLAGKLPIMTRDEFSSQYSRIRHPAFQGRTSSASTSGTSGNALQFFHAAADNAREWAAICHQWRRIGYDPLTSVRAEVRGLVTTRGIVQRFPESNMVRFSVLHLKAEHIRHYAATCARDRVKFIHGYPSAIYIMAREMLEEGILMPGIRGIMLASEMVYPHQIECIEAAFPDARVIAHYGNAERVALGAWCEHRRSYHFLPLYSHVEIASDGALIATNLFNTVNPFIRYRMNDVVADAENMACPACGRLSMPLAQDIQGRAEDYLYSPERGWIPPAIVTYPLKALRSIHQIQFFQDQPERIELRYTPRGESDCTEEVNLILKGLKGILGDVPVHPIRYESFERGTTGKMKWIVSSLTPESVNGASH